MNEMEGATMNVDVVMAGAVAGALLANVLVYFLDRQYRLVVWYMLLFIVQSALAWRIV